MKVTVEVKCRASLSTFLDCWPTTVNTISERNSFLLTIEILFFSCIYKSIYDRCPYKQSLPKITLGKL